MSTEAPQLMHRSLVELRCEKLRQLLFKSQASAYTLHRWLGSAHSLDNIETSMAQCAAEAVVAQMEEILTAAEMIYLNPEPTEDESEEVAS